MNRIADRQMNARAFRLEMESHRERVRDLATVVYSCLRPEAGAKEHPSHLRLIAADDELSLFKRYLGLHDVPKVQELDELTHHGYRNPHSIAERLADFYGFGHGELAPEQGRDLHQVILELNQLEVLQKREFFVRHRVSSETRVRFSRAEMIADVTDTGISRQDEMGLSHDRYNGSRFLIERGDLKGAFLSRWLEDNYLEILGRSARSRA